MAKRTGQKRVKRAAASGLTVRAAASQAVPKVQTVTMRELNDMTKRAAREMLGVSVKKAYSMLDSGELRGTLAEVELHGLRFLRGDN